MTSIEKIGLLMFITGATMATSDKYIGWELIIFGFRIAGIVLFIGNNVIQGVIGDKS